MRPKGRQICCDLRDKDIVVVDLGLGNGANLVDGNGHTPGTKRQDFCAFGCGVERVADEMNDIPTASPVFAASGDRRR